jgi:hypothetical protein
MQIEHACCGLSLLGGASITIRRRGAPRLAVSESAQTKFRRSIGVLAIPHDLCVY